MEIGNKKIEVKAGGTVNLYFLGDIHEGNCNCNHKALSQAVEIIKNDPNGYWFGMGDYVEAITHMSDPRFDPKSISSEYAIKDLKDLPMKQAERVFSFIAPIQDKCLALLIGNHEEQYIKRHSSNVYDRFVHMFKTSAHEEGQPPKKLGYVGFYNLVLSRGSSTSQAIGIALNHGVGGGGYLEGYSISNLHKVFKYMNADINVMGHVHQLKENGKRNTTINKNGRMVQITKLWGVSGCFLDTYIEGNPNYFESRAGIGGDSDVGMLKCEITYLRDRTDGNDYASWKGEMKKIFLG